VFSDFIDSINLNSEKVLTETLVVVSSPGNPLANKAFVDVTDLYSQTVLLPKAGCGYGLFLRHFLNTDIAKPASIIEFTSVEAIKKCVMNGVGVAILPLKSLQNEIQNKQIVPLNWKSALEISVVMVWYKERKFSPVLREFMDLIRGLKNKSI